MNPLRKALLACVAAFWALAAGCAANDSPRQPDTVVDLVILHLNDVYEIAPLAGVDQGGLARVAGLRNRFRAENGNTLTFLAGDMLSPSAMGSIEVDGERLAGRQMIDVMNRLGLDLATPGNHEFDLGREQLEQRIEESRFRWVSSNVSYEDGRPLPRVLPHVVFTVRDEVGNEARVGVFGVTLESKPHPYASYRSPIEAAREQVALLRDKVDILVALTHLSMDEDRALAESVAGIDVILGGHEHENWQIYRGPRATPIMKADANARSVYVHRLSYDTRSRRLRIASELNLIDERTPSDPALEAVVRQWSARAFDALRAKGFRPEETVVIAPVELDGLESSVRNGATELTRQIAAGMLRAVPRAQLAIFNSGSIRIDDKIPPGSITQYDAFRILPFGGTLALVEISGDKLEEVLEIGARNKGRGGFLQTDRVERIESGWLIAGKPLLADRTYRVVLNDFLLTGRETNLAMLKEGAGNLKVVEKDIVDIRMALIEQLKAAYGR